MARNEKSQMESIEKMVEPEKTQNGVILSNDTNFN